MVELTIDLVEKKCFETQASKSLTKIIDRNYVKKITHLFMNNKSISTIGDLALCFNLKVIYLQNNEIRKIENLHFAKNLTHLYLQHNNISKIENINFLVNLEKLYLGYNCISVVEGMEELTSLKELYIEKQKLEKGEFLCFDPRSSSTLSNSLKILNISGNNIIHLTEIKDFKKLQTLDARNNRIKSIENVTESISNLHYLQELFLNGNPVTKVYRYRENLIANHDILVNLDGKFITETCRNFLKKFKNERQLQQTRKKSKLTLSEDITNSLNLPTAFKKSISRAIFEYAGPKLAITVYGEGVHSQFPAWKTAQSVKGSRDNHTMPRPFWRSITKPKSTNNLQADEALVTFPTI